MAAAATLSPAAVQPVARVCVDVSLPHLDRLFDYLVPTALAGAAEPGVRVRVRFAGRLTGGFVVERAAASEHRGRLSFLQRVVSPEPALTPEIAGLARAVADWYGGTMADVLRLAVPPRHAGAERAARAERTAEPVVGAPAPGAWLRYPAGPSYLQALSAGRQPRAVWSALPDGDWAAQIAGAVATAAASGNGSVVVVPDQRDLDRLDAALAGAVGKDGYAVLAAGLGAAERYRRWLSVARGEVGIVLGTRSAMFAPVRRLGLVVLWDEGDDLHAEPRAPYPHAREVLVMRAHRSGAAALIGGFARTAEAQQLVDSGWARALEPTRVELRGAAPGILAAGDDVELARDEAAHSARLPSLALRTAREGLRHGAVLFQVPRRGYLAAVGCERCRMRLRCAGCGGPVAVADTRSVPRCEWCAAEVRGGCPQCGHHGVRALLIGARRTAEELGRAFPRVRLLTSGGDRVLGTVPGAEAIVVATPGAEPAAEGGYAAAVLLDAWVTLGRASLRAAEEALRRWMNAAALVRPGSAGGRVVVVGDAGLSPVQALIRWDPVGHARRELGERNQLRLPPTTRMAALMGPEAAVDELLQVTELPPGARVLGPVRSGRGASSAVADSIRKIVLVDRSAGAALAHALHCGLAARSTVKADGAVRVRLDPVDAI